MKRCKSVLIILLGYTKKMRKLIGTGQNKNMKILME